LPSVVQKNLCLVHDIQARWLQSTRPAVGAERSSI